MSRYEIARAARVDLKEIYRHIASDNRPAAGRLRDQFYAKFRLLARFPLIGQPRDDLEQDLRAFPVGNYVILYRAVDNGIRVIKVIHGARDLSALFRSECAADPPREDEEGD